MRSAFLCALLIALLSACAGPVARLPEPGDWASHSDQLRQLNTWQASGKLALRSPSGSDSATLVWRQAAADTRINLSGPLGVAPVRMRSDGQWLTIERDSDPRVVDLSDPVAVEAATGWAFPVHALPWWLKGLPAPDLALQALEQDPVTGGASLLRQAGWDVRYTDYGRFGNYNLPTRLVMASGELEATVLIRQWQPGADNE